MMQINQTFESVHWNELRKESNLATVMMFFHKTNIKQHNCLQD